MDMPVFTCSRSSDRCRAPKGMVFTIAHFAKSHGDLLPWTMCSFCRHHEAELKKARRTSSATSSNELALATLTPSAPLQTPPPAIALQWTYTVPKVGTRAQERTLDEKVDAVFDFINSRQLAVRSVSEALFRMLSRPANYKMDETACMHRSVIALQMFRKGETARKPKDLVLALYEHAAASEQESIIE